MDDDRTGPQSDSSRRELPIVGQPRRERADAVRNRAAILHAAERLFAERGISAVSMDAVAAEAGVGKGTLFRRFGDRAGLAVALLDERERDLQAAVLSGPPPLGPGAPPGERLRAFASSYVDFVIRHVALLHVSETGSPGARYRIGSYRLWHRHVAALVAEARPELDAEFAAHAFLAALSADVVTGLLRELNADRLRAGVDQVVGVYLGAVHSGTA